MENVRVRRGAGKGEGGSEPPGVIFTFTLQYKPPSLVSSLIWDRCVRGSSVPVWERVCVSRRGAGEEPSAVGNVCLLLCLLPGGGALDEGWLGATQREFITTSEIFPALLYSRLFVYPRLGGEAGG